jgi:NADH:ubiquinone oxidoreductase subunit
MTLGLRLFTLFRGDIVGTDTQGNRYYRDRASRQGARQRRWVIYNGEQEASRVPPTWHAWLHHTTDEVPVQDSPQRPWQRAHTPNLTGTPGAYRPPGDLARDGKRPRATGDYEPWRPS